MKMKHMYRYTYHIKYHQAAPFNSNNRIRSVESPDTNCP